MSNNPIEIVGKGQSSQANLTIHVSIIKLHKSFLILVSDQPEYGLGTITLSSPPLLEGTKAMSSPFPIFGLKNNMIANMVGNIASQKFNTPVLSLVYILEQNMKQELIMKTTLEAVLKAVENCQSSKNEKLDEDQSLG